MKDIQGREWLFRFTALTTRDLAADTKLDTKALVGDNSLLQRVGVDESLLYRVLWITIRPQAIALGITEDEWFGSLDNESLQAAAKEWVEAYINFSHPARQKVLSRTLAATQRKMDAAIQTVEAAIASGEIDRVIDRATKQMTETAVNPLPPSENSTTTAAS